jgi:hypothetical protein
MEKEQATKVGCQACKSDKAVKRTQIFVFGFGALIFGLAIYGGIKLIQDLSNLF